MLLEVTMPQLGMAQDTGKIVDWHKQPGDAVEAGEVLLEVETDKATVEIEAARGGFLSEVRADAGADVPVGGIIAIISDQPGQATTSATAAEATLQDGAGTPEPSSSAGDPAEPQPLEPAVPVVATPGDRTGVEHNRVLASPKAKWEAHRRGLDLADLERLGIPQPFHVADLERLTRPTPEEPQAPRPSQAPSRARVTVRRDALSDFIDWSHAASNGAATQMSVWSAFASSALRSVEAAIPDDGLLVETTALNAEIQTVRLLDADRTGLGRQHACDQSRPPDLRVYDLFETALSDYQPASPDGVPVVVITTSERDDHLDITLLFDEAALPLIEAARLLDHLAARVETPALHLL